MVYRECSFRGIAPRNYPRQPRLREISEADRAEEALRHRRRFEVLREIHTARDFQPILLVGVCDPVGDYSVRMLKEAVADEKAQGGFDGFRSEPIVMYFPRRYLFSN